MNLQEIKAEMLGRGFTHVQTLGGALPIAEWTPYGNGIEKTWQGETIADNKVRDLPKESFCKYDTQGFFMLGVWTFTKQETV